tara:strand:- start:26 stop:781 length:756 start_codon:yes stop_codon:yes gene_type:complete
MKKITLILLVLLGLQTQAQINYCDSLTASGTQSQFTIEINGVNTFIDYWVTTSSDSVVFQEDSMSMYQMIYNSQYDTLTTCITHSTNTCCVTWIWNGTSWARMMQQPYFCCDSITYWTDQGQGLFVGLDTTGLTPPDSIDVYWSVCNSSMCYAGTGINAFFGQITTSDTIKVCYSTILYTVNTFEACPEYCDSLIYDGFSWVQFSMGNPTGIKEIANIQKYGQIYDLLGRELSSPPIGKMYIRNNKLYMKK